MLDEAAESLYTWGTCQSGHVFCNLLVERSCHWMSRGGRGWMFGTYADEFLDLALLHALLEGALLGGC